MSEGEDLASHDQDDDRDTPAKHTWDQSSRAGGLSSLTPQLELIKRR